MAPYVIATFANSPIYAGCPTGYQSARSAVWRDVDPARTGIAYDERAPVGAYLDFALSAPAILYPTLDGDYRPFADWLRVSEPTPEEWHDHLSTLFPEVRPRGHLELRSPDAVHPRWFAAPVALVTGILYEPGSLRAADHLLGAPDPTLLGKAGTLGLHDGAIAQIAADLFQLALDGCRRLGPSYFHPDDLEQATAFFDGYTRRGRAPADDVLEKAIAA
jgi:glutamate--cysteine ligase